MKKHVRFTLGCLACGSAFLFSSQAMGAAAQITDVSDTLGTTTGGPVLNIKLSPGVNLGYALNTTLNEEGSSFAINTENTTIDLASTNRNQYGIASDYSGYYQQQATVAMIAPVADGSDAFNGIENYQKF